MNKHPTKAPSNSIAVISPLPNSVWTYGKMAWNSSIVLMIEITPMSYPMENPPREANKAAPRTYLEPKRPRIPLGPYGMVVGLSGSNRFSGSTVSSCSVVASLLGSEDSLSDRGLDIVSFKSQLT